jgi:glycosyltransferase involved in cell wall biosynthesis
VPKVRLVLVAETLQGGLGAALIADSRRAIESGAEVTIAAPRRFDDPPLHPSVTAVDIGVPESARNVVSLLRARMQLRQVLKQQSALDWTHVHGLRGLLLVWPRKRLLLTYHGAAALPGEQRVVSLLRALALRVVPLMSTRSYTVIPLRFRGWLPIWITAPNVLAAAPPRVHTADAFRLLWMSRVAAQKDFGTFLSLVRRCSRYPDFAGADVYGSIDPRIQDEFAAEAADLDVTFRGAQRDVAGVLAGDYIFCLFSHFEGRPFALEEAISAGLPVIVSDLPGNRVLVSDERFLIKSLDEAQSAVELLRDWRVRSTVGGQLLSDYRNAKGREAFVDVKSIYDGLF